MTASQPRKDAKTSNGSSAQPLVLFGLDESGKPRAAYFPAKDAALAKKAAGLMGLTAVTLESPHQTEVAAKLPPGRILLKRPRLGAERSAEALRNCHAGNRPRSAGRPRHADSANAE